MEEDSEGVCVAVTLPVAEELGVAEGEAVPEEEGDGETVRLSVALGDAVDDGVPDRDVL